MSEQVILNGKKFTFQDDFIDRKHLVAFPALINALLADLGKALQTTSHSVLELDILPKTIILDVDRPFAKGAFVTVTAVENDTQQIFAKVTNYASTSKTMTIDILSFSGEGSNNNWLIQISGPQGAKGENGIARLQDDINPILVSDLQANNQNIIMDGASILGGHLKYYTEQLTEIVANGFNATIDLGQGNVFKLDLVDDVTISFENLPKSDVNFGFKLFILHQADNINFSFAANIKWPKGEIPQNESKNGASDIYVFETINGGENWYASKIGDFR